MSDETERPAPIEKSKAPSYGLSITLFNLKSATLMATEAIRFPLDVLALAVVLGLGIMHIWMIVIAFKVHWAWGLLSWFVPVIGTLIFVGAKWKEMPSIKKPFYVWLCCYLLIWILVYTSWMMKLH